MTKDGARPAHRHHICLARITTRSRRSRATRQSAGPRARQRDHDGCHRADRAGDGDDEAGGEPSAAAPARIMAVPCPRLIPPWTIPNAWLRWDGGVACTNVALAAT